MALCDKVVESVLATAPMLTFAIPAFQRGIEWKREEVNDLITSDSPLFGTVLIANRLGGEPPILLDGLQRLAAGTAILNNLYDMVLAPKPREKKLSQHFVKLANLVQNNQPVYSHNHAQLLKHYRLAVRDGYKKLNNAVEKLIEDELLGAGANPKKFAEQIVNIFISKQIAYDQYAGFHDFRDLTKTFLSLNSTGVELSPIDLLRAELVQQAGRRDWRPEDIHQMENKFSDLFETRYSRKALPKKLGGVLGNILNDAVTIESKRMCIFPDWEDLSVTQVNECLDFIREFWDATDENDYLSEIYACGSYPFVFILLHYYWLHVQKDYSGKSFKTTNLPDFIATQRKGNAKGSGTAKDLSGVLRASYRRVLDSSLKDLYDIAKEGNILTTNYGVNHLDFRRIADVAAAINPKDASSLNGPPTKSWLEHKLRDIYSPSDCQRVFNACQLPHRGSTGKSYKNFVALHFGSSDRSWNIDHLIPYSHLDWNRPGANEGEYLLNMAPLPQPYNQAVKNMPLSEKLKAGGPYSKVGGWLKQTGKTYGTPTYLNWLTKVHYKNYKNGNSLDEQANLILGSKKPLGDERLKELVRVVSPRI